MIICFGSLNVDFIYRVEHAAASGETVAAKALTIEPGGKGGNQAAAAALDGAVVHMLGCVGQDALASTATAHLRRVGVELGGVRPVDAPTGSAAIMVEDSGANRITVAAGANALARADQLQGQGGSYLLLQMEVPAAECAAAIGWAAANGVRCILNLAPARAIDVEALRQCWLLVVNEAEAAEIAQVLGVAPEVGALAGALGIGVLRTLGADGAEVVMGGQYHRVPAFAITAVDTTAAGDCFIGVLAAALDRGQTLPEAMQRATAAASICCETAGSQNSLPSRAQTDDRLRKAMLQVSTEE